MKRIALFALATMLALGMLTGCKDSSKSKKTSSSGKKTENETVAEGNTVEEETTLDTTPTGSESKLKTLATYKGLEVSKSVATITDEDVDNQIASLEETYATTGERSEGDALENGDTANIDYVGKIDGTEFEGGSGEGYDLELGSGSFIDGFEDALIGKKVGESCTIEVTFPEDYSNTDVAGKDATFDVTINSATYSIPATVDDDFVKKNFSYTDSTTVDELKAWVKNRLYQNAIYGEVWQSKVVDLSEVESYGEKELKEAIEEAQSQMETQLTSYGYTVDSYKEAASISDEDYDSQIEQIARSYMKTQIVVNAIADKEDISVSDETYKKKLAMYAKEVSMEPSEYEEQYGVDTLRYQMLYEEVVEFVVDHVTIVEDSTEESTEDVETEASAE